MSQIAITPARSLGTIDRNLFGGFVEHLGRCVYGGLYDEGSPLSGPDGFRRDVMDLLRELRPGVLRWPGGNFASNYHWADGIGPRDARPARPELAWGGEDSNRFGTDEFLAYCAELGTEPYICLNMGNRDARGGAEYVREAKVTDLGPFTLVDAAASVTGHMDRVAVTLVNRSPSAEAARIVLRDYSFGGPAAVTTMTDGGGEDRVLPDVATSRLAEGSETATGGVLVLTLPPRSFTVIEAPISPA